jgi:hypothetical protein
VSGAAGFEGGRGEEAVFECKNVEFVFVESSEVDFEAALEVDFFLDPFLTRGAATVGDGESVSVSKLMASFSTSGNSTAVDSADRTGSAEGSCSGVACRASVFRYGALGGRPRFRRVLLVSGMCGASGPGSWSKVSGNARESLTFWAVKCFVSILSSNL